jgi:hypothetical protein
MRAMTPQVIPMLAVLVLRCGYAAPRREFPVLRQAQDEEFEFNRRIKAALILSLSKDEGGSRALVPSIPDRRSARP